MEGSIVDILFKEIGTQGIWFALFLYLFLKQDKTNKEREVKLEAQLEKSNDHLDKSIEALKDLKDVKEAVQQISLKISEGDGK